MVARDPTLTVWEALRRAEPLEAEWRRRHLRSFFPWWTLLAHAALLVATRGAWAPALLLHWWFAYVRRDRALWPRRR